MTENCMFGTIDVDRQIPVDPPLCGPSKPEVLDLQGLCDRCMGNLDLVQRVLDKFEQRLPEELAELERVLELGDAAEIALVAHRIKGNSSNISAGALQQAAAEIEDLSRAGRVAEISARLPNLREQWERYAECRSTLRRSATDSARSGLAPTLMRR